MTTVTDSDLKDIKEAIAGLGKQIAENDKNLTAKINDLDKNLSGKIIELQGQINTTNAKIDSLDKRVSDALNNVDKRITNQEFIYRSVFISIITLITGSILTTFGTSAIKYFWDNPLFHP